MFPMAERPQVISIPPYSGPLKLPFEFIALTSISRIEAKSFSIDFSVFIQLRASVQLELL